MAAAQLYSGTGNPNGVVFGNPGDIYTDESGDALYYKTTGVGTNTGWKIAAPDAVVFDDAVPAAHVNIRSDRATNQSPIDNTKAGITNLSSATGAIPSTGATGAYSTISGGDDNSASGDGATVMGGSRHNVTGELSSAVGFRNTVSGDLSHACGADNTVSGDWSTVAGRNNVVAGNQSHAGGRSCIASGSFAFAHGDEATASGGGSHAEGTGTVASGANAHAEGSDCEAQADNSHAEGIQTIASGLQAHAQGNQSAASGAYSHAEGRQCTAIAAASHAQGFKSNATRSTQFAYASGVAGDAGPGEYQTSWLVFRTNTPQDGDGLPHPLEYGEGPSNIFILAPNHAYTFRVRAICAGLGPGDTPVLATIVREFNAVLIAGVATIIAQPAQVIFGSPVAVANWTITGSDPGGDSVQFLFNSNGDVATAVIAVTAHVEWTETPFTT